MFTSEITRSHDDDLEYAALAHADGRPFDHTAKYRAFERFEDAVRAAGGRAPIGADGARMLWSEARGWFDRGETRGLSDGRSGSDAAQAGSGWRISSTARQADLDRLARQIRAVAFRAPWPDGWAVRFGELTGKHADDAAATSFPEKLIIIDEMKFRERGEDLYDLRESILHELTHISCGYIEDCATSPLFHVTLNDARARCPNIIPAWTSQPW